MRVIQDSDDEFDDDLEADSTPPVQPDASSRKLSKDVSCQPGTGSTEYLKNKIQKAHRAHFQSQPSQDEPRSSASLPEQSNKRRKTSPDVTSRVLPGLASRKLKGPVTYGKSAKSVFSSPLTGSVDEQGCNGITDRNGTVWNLEGTMRNKYALHNPAMFPEPSSTVPNATLTQQRVLQGVMAPTLPGRDSEADAPHYQPSPEPSVPWSDMMKFSPANPEEPSESSAQVEPTSDLASATPVQTPRRKQELIVSQRSRRDSSPRLRGSPLRSELLCAAINPIEIMAPPIALHSTKDGTIPPTMSSVLHQSVQTVVMTSPLWRKSQLVSIPGSDDDLAAIGLPKEQYKPRPCRSRCLKVDTELPIDYLVKLEKAKKVSRRHKTTSAANDANLITTPQKIQQICDMGFTPSTAGRALKQNNGDVMQTVVWLVSNGIDEDELAPHNTPQKQKPTEVDELPPMDHDVIQVIMRNLNEYRRDGLKVPHTVEEATVATSAATRSKPANNESISSVPDTPPNMAKIRSPKVQVVIPRTSPRALLSQVPGFAETTSKKAKRTETIMDQTELESIAQEFIVPEAKTEKKRGRGRPKKAATIDISNDIVEDVPLGIIQGQQHNDTLQTIEPNLAPWSIDPALQSTVRTPDDVHLRESEGAEDGSCAPNTAANPTALAALSKNLEKSTKNVGHSPTNKGKVSYRVGLSKRARIAPLLTTPLRTVKK